MELKNKNNILFGTKIYNTQTDEIGLLIYTWTNCFADKDVEFAACVDKNGNKYNINIDLINIIEE